MAYSVDWIAKLITIPVSDLTFVSGVNYTLDAADVHNELRRLEWAFTDGLWAPFILNHFPTVTLSGIPKTRTIEIVNGYTWEIDSSNIIVTILGIDHNLLDTFVPANGVSVLANNSVGKQDISTGSGLSGVQDAKLTAIDSAVAYHTKIINNYKEMRKIGDVWYLIIYDDGEVSEGVEILRKAIKDKDGNNITDLAAGVLTDELENTA